MLQCDVRDICAELRGIERRLARQYRDFAELIHQSPCLALSYIESGIAILPMSCGKAAQRNCCNCSPSNLKARPSSRRARPARRGCPNSSRGYKCAIRLCLFANGLMMSMKTGDVWPMKKEPQWAP